MATTTKWRIFIVTVICLMYTAEEAASSQEIMKKLTKGFVKVFEQCKTELNVGDHVLQDLFNFWREEYELLNRDLGCVVHCMAQKLDLLGEDMKMHHGNAHEFAKSHGADDEVAKQLVTMLHECESAQPGVADQCMQVLETAKCFRTKVHQLQWAPSMEVVLEEVMTSA